MWVSGRKVRTADVWRRMRDRASRRPMSTERVFLLTAVAVGLCLALVGAGRSQSYPAKPIRVILPYTPGSPNDGIVRLISPALSARLGQSVVVDNRPGGGATVGLKAVIGAEPDGYTLLFSNTPTHVIAQLV